MSGILGGGATSPAITNPVMPGAAISAPSWTGGVVNRSVASTLNIFGNAAGRSSTMLTGGLGVPASSVRTAMPGLGGSTL